MARILIVEDEPAMRMGLKDNFEFESYEVEMAMDGAEGLQKIQNGTFDLIILDVMMPIKNGWQMLNQLRKKKSTAVFILTARCCGG